MRFWQHIRNGAPQTRLFGTNNRIRLTNLNHSDRRGPRPVRQSGQIDTKFRRGGFNIARRPAFRQQMRPPGRLRSQQQVTNFTPPLRRPSNDHSWRSCALCHPPVRRPEQYTFHARQFRCPDSKAAPARLRPGTSRSGAPAGQKPVTAQVIAMCRRILAKRRASNVHPGHMTSRQPLMFRLKQRFFLGGGQRIIPNGFGRKSLHPACAVLLFFFTRSVGTTPVTAR